MILEVGFQPHKGAMQKYITKVKNICDQRLQKYVWTIGCKGKETNKSKMLSYGSILKVQKRNQILSWKECIASKLVEVF